MRTEMEWIEPKQLSSPARYFLCQVLTPCYVLVLDLAHESYQGGRMDVPMIVEILRRKEERYHPFDTFDVQEIATLMVNGVVRPWQMMDEKRIRDYVVAGMIRPTSLATKYQPVTVRETITIPAFVQAAWARQQAKVEVIAEGVRGPAKLKGDEVDIEAIPQEGDLVGLEVSELVAEELEFEIYYNRGWTRYYLTQEYAERETGASKI